VWTLLEATRSESSHRRRGLSNGEAVRLNCLADTKGMRENTLNDLTKLNAPCPEPRISSAPRGTIHG
jgi:hypothetical protein